MVIVLCHQKLVWNGARILYAKISSYVECRSAKDAHKGIAILNKRQQSVFQIRKHHTNSEMTWDFKTIQQIDTMWFWMKQRAVFEQRTAISLSNSKSSHKQWWWIEIYWHHIKLVLAKGCCCFEQVLLQHFLHTNMARKEQTLLLFLWPEKGAKGFVLRAPPRGATLRATQWESLLRITTFEKTVVVCTMKTTNIMGNFGREKGPTYKKIHLLPVGGQSIE